MIGSIISHYKILQKLGEGGMGVVYKAQDTKLNRPVALKFLPPDLIRDPEAKKRFLNEAQTASSFQHNNVSTIHEINETDDGRMFICMDYYEGQTLQEKIAGGWLSIEEAVDITIQIAQGLEKAHEAGIIHRDIKPANIFITKDGVVKILDFGIAKLAGQFRETKRGATIGTMAYMSPEQVQAEEVDHRVDIWSLGVVLYEMLTSQVAFPEEYEAAIIYSIINVSPVPPDELRDDIPSELDQVVLTCLHKKTEHRYQTIQALLNDLKKFKKTFSSEKQTPAETYEKPTDTKKETERRQATLMFVGISEYDDMLERLGIEEMAMLMKECLSIFAEAIDKYEGHIEEITGGNLLALFGVPEAIEQAPHKAINSAIELRKGIDRLNRKEDLEVPLHVHIGINTGMVITGSIDSDTEKGFSVLGEAKNLAQRIKDATEKDQIYVGPLTYRYTKNEFEYRKLSELYLKDRKEPVSVFELLSMKEKLYRSLSGSKRIIHSEMVGRDSELDRLKLHVLKVINGEGSIVNVIGEAGIGKSRLIAELIQTDEMKKVSLLQGRSHSIGKNLSFHPFIDLIKNWSSIKEDDSKYESVEKLKKIVINIDPERFEDIFPFIGTLMGVKLTGQHAELVKGINIEAFEKLIFKSLRELISKSAERTPIVFILEDLHWADLTSIELLEYLFRLAENERILFINVLRPNYEKTGERILNTSRMRYGNRSTEVFVESLNKGQSETLIHNLLKIEAIPVNIRNLITERAEGNPFFIEEVVRSFIDDGLVEFEAGYFRITEQIDSVIIPETINDVLMARIDKLDQDTRSLIKVASVIGRSFFYKILVEVAESIAEIDNRLNFLKEVQLIKEHKRMEEIEYLFKHALAQEAVYNSILIKKRKEIHLNVARSIESVFHERLHEFYGMLAFHYSSGGDLDKTEEYLIKAGEEALKSSASNEALHYYQEALRIYLDKHGKAADPVKIQMLDKNIALAFFNKGQFNEAVYYFDKALAFYGEKLPKRAVSMILKFLVGLLGFLKCLYFPHLTRMRVPTTKDKEIISLYEKKIRALSTANPKRMFIESFYWVKRLTHSDLSRIEHGAGLFAMLSSLFAFSGISFRVSKKILEHVRDMTDMDDVKSVLYYKFSELTHYMVVGGWEALEPYDDDLVNRGLRFGEIWATTGYALFHGEICKVEGKFSKGLEIAERLHQIRNVYDDDFSKTTSYLLDTKLLLRYRKLNEAFHEIEHGITFFNQIGYDAYDCELYAIKARAHILMGNVDEAENAQQNANKILSRCNLAPMSLIELFISELRIYIYRLEMAKNNGQKNNGSRILRMAFKAGKKAIQLSKKVAFDATLVLRLVGTIHWLADKQDKALRYWRTSIDTGERLGCHLELSRTYMEVGKRLLEHDSRHSELNEKTAQHYLTKTKTLFTDMNLSWDLKELADIHAGNETD